MFDRGTVNKGSPKCLTLKCFRRALEKLLGGKIHENNIACMIKQDDGRSGQIKRCKNRMLSSFHEGKRLGQAIGLASKITVARKKSGTNNHGSAA
jgi:hypothetical protein